MTELAFLSPDLASSEAVWRSPLERALAHAPEGIEDVSRTGKIEVRGNLEAVEVEAEVVRITPQRALVLCPPERTAEVRERLQEQIELAIDMSAAWAGVRLRGEILMRRLTELDLGDLPAVGSVAHVQALVIRDEGETFRLFFPQEYGHYLAEVVVDTAGGITQ